jgi:orotidine-5'-phosphate decarboxylase
MTEKSRFSASRGVLFAGDLSSEEELLICLDSISPYLEAIKLGNALLYDTGARLVRDIRLRYGLPVVVDLKLTDVSHVATRVVKTFAAHGAAAIIVAGVCGREVLRDLVTATQGDCEIWVFTEFTNDSGLIEPSLADHCVREALDAGVLGFQAPGTRPHRIEDIRSDVGERAAIVACGIGVQGGRFGSAISAGANLEIIGRSIYGHPEPSAAAAEAKGAISRVAVPPSGDPV